VVIEFKVKHKTQSVNAALEDAAKQIREKRYAEELVAAGASPVHEYAMVFDGKRAAVKRVDDLLAKTAKKAKTAKAVRKGGRSRK
jgi:PD-(D/E)XK nuclease superfamily